MSPHVLVTTNNFWVGGRETYVATYVRALAGRMTADLLCSSLHASLPETAAFRAVGVAGGRQGSPDLRTWLEAGSRLVADRRPALIWGQHYDLLPAWLLARLHGIPLLVTFHGPLVGAGRPNDLAQALGMTLALSPGGLVSGVSPEVCSDLASLGRTDACCLPNVVALGEQGGPPPAWPPRRWLLVTRQEKLGHLRAAIRLFAAFRDRLPGAHLVVASGSTPDDGGPGAGRPSQLRRTLSVLGFRWCSEQGASVWRALPAIHWTGYAAAPRDLARQSDLVLGMGRVVLEGLAEARPAVLVGYESVHGLVDAARWEAQARSNFSGRGLAAPDVETCIRELATPAPPTLPAPTLLDVSGPATRLLRLIEDAGAVDREPGTCFPGDLRERLGRGAPEEAVLGEVAARLAPPDWERLFRLARG